MVTGRRACFVVEYCKDFNATKAYERAGYSPNGAAQAALRLLKDAEIQEAVEDRKEMMAHVAGLTPEWILHQWMMIASANPSDLVRVVHRPCGGCWAIADPALPVNPDCSTCKGDGIRGVEVTPTADLKGAAKRLFAGALQTRDGVKVLMRDQDAAIRNLADYLGMLNKTKGEISGPGGGPVPMLVATPADLSDEQLMAIAASVGVADGVSTPALPASTTIDAALETV